MSRLSDQVEAKIARANRAFRLSSRIIAATQQELESHGAWLDSHRASWAEEIERHRRLLNRKLAMRSAGRFAVSLVFAAPFALARAIERRIESRSTPEPRLSEGEPPFTRAAAIERRIESRSTPEPRRSEGEPPFTRAAALQRRISRIEPPAGTAAATSRPRPQTIAAPKAASPLAAPGANVSPASARSRVDRVSTPAIAALALLIVAAGMLRAVFSVPPSAE
ncbi:MAG: hypothetical protein AB7G54_05065, partial [Methyloceanibacter sp.]